MDLIERLRGNNPDMPTRDRFEASDEIERLTERCEAYKGQVESGAHIIERQDGEIERLLSAIAQMRSQVGDNIKVQEAEQRGFIRGAQQTAREPK